jgi:hypothetical protein
MRKFSMSARLAMLLLIGTSAASLPAQKMVPSRLAPIALDVII